MKGNPIRPYWRALADALMPALPVEYIEGDGSLRAYFAVLLPATVAAHRENDEVFLVNAYAFAHWCMGQPDRELWNSAGVAFFKHLFDDLPPDAVAPWIASQVFFDVNPLLEAHLGAEEARKVRKRFEARKETLERNYPGVIENARREIGKAS